MIDPIGPEIVFSSSINPTQIVFGRVNARLGEVWTPSERAEGREVTYRQIGITSLDAAQRVADAYLRRGWNVTVDHMRELLRFRVGR